MQYLLEKHPTHQCPWKDEIHRYLAQQKAPQQSIVLTHPFPAQPQHMVATNSTSPQGGMAGTPHHEGYSLNATIFMYDQTINLQTQVENYHIFDPSHAMLEESSSSQPEGPLQIEKPTFDVPLWPPKGVLSRMTHNPNTWASHKYNIMEDLAQAPCAMSTLKVLQRYPM
jgi:hypothetical protein